MNFPEFFSRHADDEQYSSFYVRFFVVAVVVLFAITHAPINFVMSWYDRFFQILHASGYLSSAMVDQLAARKDSNISEIIVPVRTWIFFIALLITAYPLFKDIRKHIEKHEHVYKDVQTYTSILIPFGILCLLVVPSQLGLGGNMYARMSIEPLSFNDSKLWFYQRLLMPSIAYFLQLKGPVLYFFFSLFVTLLMFLLVHLFFITRGITLSRLELTSLGTSSFLMTQLQIPGYTEQLALVFILLLFIIPTTTMGRLSLAVLSLLAHEISIVPLAFISLMYFTRKENMMLATLVFFYCFFWIASFGGNISLLLSVRDVYGKSGWMWAVEHPYRLLAGIALSYKLLWGIIGFAIIKFQNLRVPLAGFILIAIAFTIIGVDTSRLMGFGILSLLIALFLMKEYFTELGMKYKYVLIGNIIVPTFFIGTNIGIALVNGIYSVGGENGKIVLNGLYQMIYLGVVMK
ncbi:MAG: hypothetical protein M0R68_06065 [Bacteroidetes bacterium]|nr:hypothetical protein [Bacteroidota bacterium]